MADQSLGTISALIRLKLTELAADVASATSMVTGMAAEVGAATQALAAEVSTSLAAVATATASQSAAAVSAVTTSVGASAAAIETSMGSAKQLLQEVGTASLLVGGAITAGLGVAVKAGSDWNQELLHISANTSMTKQQTDEMRRSVEDIGSKTAAPLSQLAQGYMHVTNFGFQAAEAQKVLAEASKYAVATGDDASKVAEVLAGTLHNFGMGADEAGGAMNLLHTAAARANSTLGEFASAAGPAFAAAHSYGISMAEAAAAIQVFTQHQYTASEGTTLFANLVEHVANPTRITKKALEDLGLQHSKLAKDMSFTGLQAVGVVGFLRDLDAAAVRTGKSSEELSHQLFRGRMGGTGTAVLVQNLREYAKAAGDLKEIFDKGAAGVWQFDAANTSLAGKIAIVQNNFQILAAKIEEDLLPIINAVLTGVRDLIQWFSSLPEGVQKAIVIFTALAGVALLVVGAVATLAGWIASLAAAFTAAMPVITAIGAALTPFVGWIIAIAAVIALLVAAWVNDWGNIREHTQEFVEWIRPYLQEAWNWMVSKGTEVMAELRDFWARTWPEIRELANAAITAIRELLVVFAPVWKYLWEDIAGTVRVIWALIEGLIKATWHEIEGILVVGIDILSGHWDKAWSDMEHYLGAIMDDCIGIVRNAVNAMSDMVAGMFADIRAEEAGAAAEAQSMSMSAALHQPFTPMGPAAPAHHASAARAHASGGGGGGGGGGRGGGGRGGGGGGALDDLKARAEEARKAIEDTRDSIYKLTHDDFDVRLRDALKTFYDRIKSGVPNSLATQELGLEGGSIAKDRASAMAETMRKIAPFASAASDAMAGFGKMAGDALKQGRVSADDFLETMRNLAGWIKATAVARTELLRQQAGAGLKGLIGSDSIGDAVAGAGSIVAKARAQAEETARVMYEMNHAEYADWLHILLDKAKDVRVYSEEWLKLRKQIDAIVDGSMKKISEPMQKYAGDWNKLLTGMKEQMTSVFEGAFKDLFDHGWRKFFNDVLQGFAKMLEQMLEQMLAKAAVFGILNILTGGAFSAGSSGTSFGKFLGFDDWGNDRKAQHWGFDYADHFSRGMAAFGSQSQPAGSRSAQSTVHAPITVHATINNGMDVRDLAKQLATHIQQRGPGYVV